MALNLGGWRELFKRKKHPKSKADILENLKKAIDKNEIPQNPDFSRDLASLQQKTFKPGNNNAPTHSLTKLSNIINPHYEDVGREGICEILAKTKVYAFVGPSGTGKSTRAIEVANHYQIDYFIDDGLLINGSRILCGTSAKRAKTRIESVRQAIFIDALQADTMRRVLVQHQPKSLMILGTSDAMLTKICDNLWLPQPSHVIRIEDVTTEEERWQAKQTRMRAGQHTIPVPSLEIKHEFNGSFSESFNRLFKRLDRSRDNKDGSRRQNHNFADNSNAKTVVRPTFSTLGSYSISDEAIHSMALIVLKEQSGLYKVLDFSLNKEAYGVVLNLEIAVVYGYNAQKVMNEIQYKLNQKIEHFTSINVMAVNVKACRVVKTETKDNRLQMLKGKEVQCEFR